jgi:hypothetical protein
MLYSKQKVENPTDYLSNTFISSFDGDQNEVSGLAKVLTTTSLQDMLQQTLSSSGETNFVT